MVGLLAFLFASGLGFGLSFWIFGTLLERSNNIGDSRGTSNDYRAYVNYTARRDKMSKSERESFCNMYGEDISVPSAEPKGSEKVRRLTEEEIERYRQAGSAVAAGGNTAPAQSNTINDSEEEFRRWESSLPKSDMSGIFKPLDEN